MKPVISLFIVTVLACLLLSACGTTAAGPQAWIDKPLDNTSAPLAPLSIIAHASDSDGVVGIEFYADNQLLIYMEADGGRLGWAEYEWNPPGSGDYLIGARGVSNNGAVGTLATSWVRIIEAEESAPTQDEVETEPPITEPSVEEPPAVPEEPPAVPAVTTPSVVAKMDANCREGPGTAFDVYGSLLNGQEAVIKGRMAADSSWLLIAIAGRTRDCWIAASTVNVSGNLDVVQIVPAPAAPPPAAVEPPPVDIQPPSVIDTSPPIFVNIAVSPNSIITEGGGCSTSPRTTTVAAAVGDTSGINVVTAHWYIGNAESGVVSLSLGGLGYWATIGPVHNAGTMEIYLYAEDTLGYGTNSGKLFVTVQDCPD